MSKQQLIGMNIFNIANIIECREKRFAYCLDSAYKGESMTTLCSLTLNNDNKEIKIAEITLSGFGHDEKNKLIMVARDITKRVEEEKFLRMQTRQAQMGEMISMIAHQWRQPLAIINAIASQMRLQAMISEKDEGDTIDNMIKIEEQSTYLSHTISAYRDFFRPDKPKEHFTVLTLIDNALSLIDHTLKNHGIKVEKVVKRDSNLFTYRNEILQVIIALFKNSLDAFMENSSTSGKITISVEFDLNYGIIHIRDNAGGIAPEIIHKLFIPYFTTKMKSNGTGLGLYMSRMIIEDHCQGVLEVESIGIETVFTIKLPLEKGE